MIYFLKDSPILKGLKPYQSQRWHLDNLKARNTPDCSWQECSKPTEISLTFKEEKLKIFW